MRICFTEPADSYRKTTVQLYSLGPRVVKVVPAGRDGNTRGMCDLRTLCSSEPWKRSRRHFPRSVGGTWVFGSLMYVWMYVLLSSSSSACCMCMMLYVAHTVLVVWHIWGVCRWYVIFGAVGVRGVALMICRVNVSFSFATALVSVWRSTCCRRSLL